jgi:uncharacterized damage-inducible protein DinB
MDILDRLLGHDAWTTQQLLLRCRELTDEQLDHKFDIGDRSLRGTFAQIIGNMAVWTDLMAERSVRQSEGHISVEELLDHLSLATKDFAEVSCRMRDEGRLDETYLDTLDNPPARKSFGGTIVHITTHSMHHRAQALYIMEQLGLTDLQEGDALGWERLAFS